MLSYEYNKSKKTYSHAFFLTTGSLYLFIYLFIYLFVYSFIYLFTYFLKITKIKVIKEEIQNNTKVWTNQL